MYSSDSQWQTFTVPDGVASITIEASGAYGGGFCDQYDGGGAPGAANGTLAVTSGEVVKVFVGFQGANASLNLGGSNCDTGDGAGGYGGGGRGGFSGSYGAGFDGAAGGGGGASVVTANGTLELVAGGGGGTGQGGEAEGYLPSTTYGGRTGSGGAGGGGVNRTTGETNGTANGFAGQGVGGICECDDSGADGGTLTSPGAGGKAGMSDSAPLANGTTYATASAGHDGSGPATAVGAASGGQGAGNAKACRYDETNRTPAIAYSEGGGGGGGYYGGGGGGCGLEGGGGGGGGSSYVAPDMTSTSFANVVNPPVADNDPSLDGGYYSNTTSGLVTVAYPTCSDSSDQSDQLTSHDLSRAKGGSCPLTVTVKQLETPRSGLAVHSAHYNEFPVDFVDSNSSSGATRFQCESGCTDLLIKVVNPKTNKAVVGATVNASIGDIEGLTGSGFLCAEEADGKTDTSTCGRYVSGLKTNSDGQLYLRYWLPGVIKTASSTLNVTAKKKCDETSCPSKELEGSLPPTTVTVAPYLIYQNKVSLSEDQVEDIGAWAGGTRLFTKFLKVSSAGPKVLKYSLQWVKAFVTSSEKVVEALELLEKVEPIAGTVEVLQSFTELWEREAMIDMFLQVMNLSPIGVGDPPSEASASSSTNFSFANKIVNYGVAVPFNLGADGAWWGIAKELNVKDGERSGYGLTLNVYEVSTCEQGKDCDPGYANNPGDATVYRDGIDPELAFYLTLTYQGYNFGTYNFMLPYDAIAWTETQPNLTGVINDFK